MDGWKNDGDTHPVTNVLAVVMTLWTVMSRECPPLWVLFVCFFCQIYCFSPKINVHSYNSLSTFNVCMAAVVTKVCVESSSCGSTRRKEKHRRANLSPWRHLGEKVRYGCQFVLHVCVLRCERGECGRVRVWKLCSACQHSVSVKPESRYWACGHRRMCWACQSRRFIVYFY